jgi:hypothetical protein
LRDTNNDGKADIIKRFGPDRSQRNGGGTGIVVYKGALYAEEGDTISKRIVRYQISTDSMTPTSAKSDVIVNGLPANRDHPMHPFVIDGSGNLFMDVGSASNSCQVKDRTSESPGNKPCTELRTRAVIRKYDANKTTSDALRQSATRPAFATPSASLSIPMVSFIRRSTGAISSPRIGLRCTRPSAARIFPRRSC